MDYYTVNENFIESIHNGYIADAKKLMEHEQFNVHYENESGTTHLQAAAETNNTEILDALYAKGVDPRKDGEALCRATAWNNLNSMSWLIEHGSDVHIDNEKPLRYAIFEDHREAAQMLISNGSNAERAIDSYQSQDKFKIMDKDFEWVREIATKVDLANKLQQNLAPKDSYEEMMKKLGIEAKAKKEQTLTRGGSIKL